MSIKILNEGFELLHKNSLCEEKSNSSDLEKALERALNNLAMRQEMNIKKYEIAFQDAIESQYPDKSWWEVTDCDIFYDLAENRDPSLTIKHILAGLKPELKEAVDEDSEKEFKVRFYKIGGKDEGKLDHEEFFNTKEDAVKAFNKVFKKELFSLNPTVWKKQGKEWKRILNSEMKEAKQRKPKKAIKESLRRKRLSEDETIKRYSDHVPQEKRKYWYFTTHGVQPGSIPRDLNVLEIRDGQNDRGTQGTFVMLDGVLNTSELRKYDMRELAPKEETERRRIRPQGKRITAWESLKNKKKKSFLKEDYITDLVAEILSGKVKKPSYKVFKWKSNNGDSGEVTYRGVDYAFRKLPNGDYKVMRSSDAGWNWSETLFKESKLREGKNLKEAEAPAGYSPKKQRTLKEAKWSNKWPRYNFEFEDGWKISAVNEEEAVEKYDDIQKNIHKGASRSSKELDALAQHLYDSNDEWSFNYFSDDELSILWSMCGVLSSKAYDDEVYNAITNRPDEKNIFNKAKDMAVSSVKTNESFYKKQESFKRTKVLKENKKKLTESFDDMEVFMNTWANYNENGADSGITPTGWMSIDDAIEYCEEYADYEPFINDTDNIPFDDINEYSNASSVLQELKELQESGVDEDILEAIIEATGYSVKEAIEIAERGDYYWYPGISSYTDLAYAVIDEIGSLKDALGDRVVNYIDEDQMRREYRLDIRETMRDTAEQEVDDAHAGEVDISNVPTSKEFSIDEWFDEDDEYTEDDLREQISDDLEYEYDSAPVSFDIEVSNDGKKVTAKNIEWDGYDREQEIEDCMDEHEDEWLDMIIGEEIEAAERGEVDLSNYFDYEAFGRDLSFDGYTITDKGIILVM